MMRIGHPSWEDFDALVEQANLLKSQIESLGKKAIMLPVKHPQEGKMSDTHKHRIGNVPRPFCQPVELLTNDGYHVASVECPPFLTPPEVIIWGERVFVPCEPDFNFKADAQMSTYSIPHNKKRTFYREAFAWAVPHDCVTVDQ